MSTTCKIVIAVAIATAGIGLAGCGAQVAGTPTIGSSLSVAATSQPVAPTTTQRETATREDPVVPQDTVVPDDTVVPLAHVTSDAAHQAVVTMANGEAAIVDIYRGAGSRLSASELNTLADAIKIETPSVYTVSVLIDIGAFSPVEVEALVQMATEGLAINDAIGLFASNDVITLHWNAYAQALADFAAA